MDYLIDNEVGQADIWVASDLRRSDWRPDDGLLIAFLRSLLLRVGIVIGEVPFAFGFAI